MNKLLSILLAFFSCLMCFSQELKVMESPDKNKINSEVSNGIASIIFDSKVKDLYISNESNDERIDLHDGRTIFLIKPEADSVVQEIGYPRREYILKTPKTSEYLLSLKDIMPKQVYYYTVTLPNRFPLTLSAEFLFSKSTSYGFRITFGKQIGGYVSYRWGKYKPSGNSIDNITTDGDISQAKYLGYIREAITGGVRIGILHKDVWKTKFGLYLLVGGGYGTYGRQWQNPTELEGNIYFYSDFIKGFNGDLAIQCTLGNWIVLSAGADAVFSKRRTSFDYQLGIGFNLNFTKLFKKKSE